MAGQPVTGAVREGAWREAPQRAFLAALGDQGVTLTHDPALKALSVALSAAQARFAELAEATSARCHVRDCADPSCPMPETLRDIGRYHDFADLIREQ